AQHPSLLSALPILGKQLLFLFFLLIPISIVLVLWYKNYISLIIFMMASMPWIWWGMHEPPYKKPQQWHQKICSLPCMIRAHDSQATMRILTQHIRKLIAVYPEVSIIIMPESALDSLDYECLYTLHETYLAKQLHI